MKPSPLLGRPFTLAPHLPKNAQILTRERSVVGGWTLWRYLTRAVIVARLDTLNAILRAKDTHAEEAKRPNKRVSARGTEPKAAGWQSTAPLPPTKRIQAAGGHIVGSSGIGAIGLEEREKELIRMKIERLDAAKTIVEREHALHGGGGGGSSGGSGSGR